MTLFHTWTIWRKIFPFLWKTYFFHYHFPWTLSLLLFLWLPTCLSNFWKCKISSCTKILKKHLMLWVKTFFCDKSKQNQCRKHFLWIIITLIIIQILICQSHRRRFSIKRKMNVLIVRMFYFYFLQKEPFLAARL